MHHFFGVFKKIFEDLSAFCSQAEETLCLPVHANFSCLTSFSGAIKNGISILFVYRDVVVAFPSSFLYVLDYIPDGLVTHHHVSALTFWDIIAYFSWVHHTFLESTVKSFHLFTVYCETIVLIPPVSGSCELKIVYPCMCAHKHIEGQGLMLSSIIKVIITDISALFLCPDSYSDSAKILFKVSLEYFCWAMHLLIGNLLYIVKLYPRHWLSSWHNCVRVSYTCREEW